MPAHCSAFGCKNRNGSCDPQISFHRFPSNNKKLLNEWELKIRRKDWKASRYSRLCSKHFTPDDYIQKPGAKRKHLKENAVPSVFIFSNTSSKPATKRRMIKAATDITKNQEAIPNSRRESASSNSELQLNQDSIVESCENKLPDRTIQEDMQIFSIKEEFVSDFEAQEIEKENCDANEEIDSSFTLEKITVPNQWWAVSCTPKFMLCAKWDTSYACDRKVIIENDLNVKLFLKDHEIFEEDLKLSSIAEVSSLLFKVDRYHICPGIDKFKEKCLKYEKERDERKSVWCINCRRVQKAMRQQLRKNSGLTREEKKEAKIKADKRHLRNVIKQNERLKKKVGRLRNRIKVLMHKDMIFDYDSTTKNIDVTSDIDDTENDFDIDDSENDFDIDDTENDCDINDTENEIHIASDVDDVESVQSAISTSEMVANSFYVTPDTGKVENATPDTFHAKVKIASQGTSDTDKVKNAIFISSDSKKGGNASQKPSMIVTSNIGKEKSIICNSSKTGKVKHAIHVASGTDVTQNRGTQNQTVVAEIYITS